MNTLAEKLTRTKNAVNSIRTTVEKTNNEPIEEVVSAVEDLKNNSGGGGKYAPQFISFYSRKENGLIEDLKKLDTSNITRMVNMFAEILLSDSLDKNLDLSSFNTSNVNNMQAMFKNSNFTQINLSSFNTSNVINMSEMFYGCRYIPLLDISNFDTSKVTNTVRIFSYCIQLTTIIINNTKVFPATSTATFDNSPIKNGTCYVYVPDNLVNNYKNATNWSVYAVQIKPISELPV